MERDFYAIIWIKPPGLANNKVLKVANAVNGIGTQSNLRPEEKVTLKPNVRTLRDDEDEIIQIASAWIKAGKVSALEQAIDYVKQVVADALEMAVQAMDGVMGYTITDKQGVQGEINANPEFWGQRT